MFVWEYFYRYTINIREEKIGSYQILNPNFKKIIEKVFGTE